MKVRTPARIFGAAGFTLVELLTAMVIAAILIAIAAPTYTAQTRKSRRTEARTALLDLAARQERFFSTTNSYSSTPADLGYTGTAFPLAVGSGYYKVSVTVTAGPPATYTLTATAVTGKGQEKDTQCASFTVVQTGKQTAANSAAADVTSSCWG